MTLLDLIVLAIVQGLTEFLPVSSSGHLVLSRELLGMQLEHPLVLDVALHVGTLLAVLVIYRGDVATMVGALIRWVGRREERVTGERRLLGLVLVGSIPAAVLGLLLADWIEHRLAHPAPVGVALLATAAVLWWSSRPHRLEHSGPPDRGRAFFIGCAQAVALVPGCSRSGWTISAALSRGVSKIEAARFSFLLAIPAVGGAALLQTKRLVTGEVPFELTVPQLLIAIGVSAVSGYLACRLLLVILVRGRLSIFAVYCAVVGALALAFGSGMI